jgi:hypothetical protein
LAGVFAAAVTAIARKSGQLVRQAAVILLVNFRLFDLYPQIFSQAGLAVVIFVTTDARQRTKRRYLFISLILLFSFLKSGPVHCVFTIGEIGR